MAVLYATDTNSSKLQGLFSIPWIRWGPMLIVCIVGTYLSNPTANAAAAWSAVSLRTDYGARRD